MAAQVSVRRQGKAHLFGNLPSRRFASGTQSPERETRTALGWSRPQPRAGSSPLQAKGGGDQAFKIVALAWHEKRKAGRTPRAATLILHRLEVYLFPKLGVRPIDEITAPELLIVAREIEAMTLREVFKRIQPEEEK